MHTFLVLSPLKLLCKQCAPYCKIYLWRILTTHSDVQLSWHWQLQHTQQKATHGEAAAGLRRNEHRKEGRKEGRNGRRKHGQMDGKTDMMDLRRPRGIKAVWCCWHCSYADWCVAVCKRLHCQHKKHKKEKDNNESKWGSQQNQYSQWCKATTDAAEREQETRQKTSEKDLQIHLEMRKRKSICINTEDKPDNRALSWEREWERESFIDWVILQD